jgi:RHS repeat-associated core domain
MVLTEEKQNAVYPPVTFEDANVNNEQTYYEKVNVERVTRSGNGSDKEQLLRKNTQSIGAGKLLKVMVNDKLQIKVDYFTPNDATDNTNANGLQSVITQLLSILNSTAPAPVHGNGGLITNDLQNSIPFTDFLQPQIGSDATPMPKAYLNILFFDEQFKFVPENSEIVPVTAKGVEQQLLRVQNNAKVVPKNGYAYIYVSNESNNLVYFDNLQIIHEKGALLEETHYYPFGLTMAGISSKAFKANYSENRRKFNYGSELASEEFSDGSGLEWYETNFRSLDPQIGRWWQIDPHAEYHLSTTSYGYVLNNPLLYNDPFGLDTVRVKGEGSHKIKVRQGDVLAWTIGETTSYYTYDPGNENAVNGFVGAGIDNREEQLPEVTVTATKKDESYKLGNLWLPGLSTGVAVGSYKMYNDKTWYSLKKFKTYNQTFNGNGATGGKIKHAKSISTKLGRVGYGLGFYNAYDINVQYNNGEISQGQMIAEQTSNTISTFGGIYGAAWGVGWEAGRYVTSIPWYRANIRPVIQDALGIKRNEIPKARDIPFPGETENE